MATMGPDGMTQAAEQSMAKAHYLAGKLTALDGVELAYDGAYFQEFVTTLPQRDGVLDALDAQGILGGLPLGEGQILWCATERISKAELDRAAANRGGGAGKMKLIFEKSVPGRRCTILPPCDVDTVALPEELRRAEKPGAAGTERDGYLPPLHGVGQAGPRRQRRFLPPWLLHHEV